MNDNSDFTKFLAVAQNRVEHQHNVLWKVEVHYTWFVYIIAGALASVLLIADLELNLLRVLIPILGGLGIIMSIIGYYVIRLEGEYLQEDQHLYQKTLDKLPEIKALHPPQEQIQEQIQKQKSQEWLDARSDANKCFTLLIGSFLLNVFPMSFVYMLLCRKPSIKISDKFKKILINVRDLFQITMLLALILFVAAIIFIYLPVAESLLTSIPKVG